MTTTDDRTRVGTTARPRGRGRVAGPAADPAAGPAVVLPVPPPEQVPGDGVAGVDGDAAPAGTGVVGRDAELAHLRRRLTASRDHGVAVVVEGEAGIGKTTLVSALVRAAGPRTRVLRCTGLDADTAGGLTGLHELLHPLLPDVDALPPRQRSALLTAFGHEDGPAPDRLLIGLAALGLLEEAAASAPLLVVVEDLQWLDAASADVVSFAARRLTTSPVLLVATVRTSGGTSPRWRAAPWEHLELQPLAPAAAATLLDAAVTGLRPAARARVLEEARGNPLALRELGSALAAAGHVLPPGQSLPTTQRLEQAFLADVDRLPAATRRLLLLVAAEGGEMPLTRLVRASGAPERAVADLDPAEHADLVGVAQGQVRFRHPLVRSAVYGGASLPERAAAHRALAGVAADPGRAVWHRAAGTHAADEDVAAALEATAHQAVRRGAPEEAFAAMERAAELSPEVPARVRRLAAAGEVARRSGLVAEAARVVRTAVPLAEDPAVVCRLALTSSVLSVVHTGDGREPADLVRGLVAVCERLAGPDGDGAVEQRLSLLFRAAVQASGFGVDERVRGLVAAALGALPVAPGHPLLDVALAALDPHRHGARVQGRFPVLAAHAAQRQSDGVAHVAHVAEAVHDLEGAHELWDLAVRTAHDTGAVADEAHALAGRGSLRLATGQVEGAVADLQLSLRIAVDSEQLLMAGYAEALLARAHAWRGEHPQALAACARSAGLTGPRPFAITVASRRWAAGLVALAEQRPEDAWTQLQGVGVHPPTAALALGDLVEAAVRTGRPEVLAAARAAAAAAEREAQSLQAHHLQALVHRARALLHAHDGDADGAQAAFEAAGRAGADGSCPLELARTRLLHGEWLRRQRRIVDARELLAAALTGFEAAGARSLARRAGAELRAAGVVPAVAVGDGGEDPAALLTAQELQIARLAASGLTNKEIADKVYLSHRTIAAHLYKAFPKLGITHRTQLRDAIAGPRAHPAGVDEPTPAAAPPESAPVPEPVPVPVGAVGARPAAGPSPDVPPAPAPVALSARFADVAVVAASADEVAAAAARQLVTDFDPTLVSVVLRGPRPGVLRHWSVRGGGLDVDAHGWRTASLPHESPSLAPARRGRGDFHETLATFETRCPLVQGVVRSAGLRALVDLPLTASGRVVGFLVLGWDTEQDLPPAVRRTLEEFAATCAQALERVLAAARGSSLLRSLQAVVPERLVSTPHVQLAGRRLAAGLAGGPGPHAGEEVGGDWYDAFAGEGGSTVLIVGDVTGHGPAVAATAASLRAVLASHVLDRPSPAHALTRLDCAVERLALPAGATAVVLEATPAPSGCYRLRWSNAGHPPPLVLLPDGAVEPLRSVPELPVGVDAQAVRRDHEREVPAGSTLVLVTDGVLETRTQDVVTGLEKLGADLARGRGLAPQALVDRLLAGVAAEVEDDVTVLAARLGPPAAASAPAHGLPVLPVMPVLPVQAGALAAAVPRPGALA